MEVVEEDEWEEDMEVEEWEEDEEVEGEPHCTRSIRTSRRYGTRNQSITLDNVLAPPVPNPSWPHLSSNKKMMTASDASGASVTFQST